MIISPQEGIYIFVAFAIIMVGLVLLNKTKQFDLDTFLVSNRKVSWIQNGISIAVTWIWGPALFLSSMQAYNSGIPGLFWFLLPNFTCFFIFTYFAVKFRKFMPNGYTLAEFMSQKYAGNKPVHISYVLLILLCQVTAVVLNSAIGAALISLVTGINPDYAILGIVALCLFYSLISGFKASIITDCAQMLIIYAFIFSVIPYAIFKMGGINVILNNIGGINNNINIFDPKTLIYFAIPTFVTLWTGPITDQMFYQRVMGSKVEEVKKSFISAAFFYIVVPSFLSLLGFIGVALFNQGIISNFDEQLIGGIVVNALFSKTIVYFYCIMALAGLCSTIDSALCATSSIGCIDIYKSYLAKKTKYIEKKHLLFVSRFFMLLIAIIGASIALFKPSLIAMFFIIGTVRAAGCFPTILTLFTNRIPANAIPTAIASAILFSLPLSIYSNTVGNQPLIVLSSLSALFLPLFICLCGVALKNLTFMKK